jgi:hypothetical protein
MRIRVYGERGAALVVAVLLVLALALLAHGTLLLARQELAASRSSLRLLQANAAAEAAARVGMDTSMPTGSSETPVWDRIFLSSTRLETGVAEARLLRLSREHWLLEGTGRSGPGAWMSRDTRLVWILDPAARVGAFQGVIEVGQEAPVAVLGAVESGGLRRDVPPLDAFLCRPWSAVLDSLFRGTPLPAVATVEVSTGGEPSLGLLGASELLDRIPVSLDGIGTPGPREDLGRCLTDDPWNWGDPDRADRPCGAHQAGRASRGDLRVEAGVGQGLLVVLGDLRMSATRFHGILLVGGRLQLQGGAQVVGFARALGGLEIDDTSSFVGSGCRALRALEGLSPTLRRLLAVPAGRLGPP